MYQSRGLLVGWNVRGALAFVLVLTLFCQAFAQTAAQFPALTGRVVDNANLLSPSAEAQLTTKLAAHETATSQQVVVATIPSLNGGQIDLTANRLFRNWQLGDKERNDGVLLLVARDDRKLRIEVGYGLEGTLTDALSSYIIRNTIVPKFRDGQFEQGIVRGTDQILEVLTSDTAALEEWRSRAGKRDADRGEGTDWLGIVFIAIWCFFMFGFPILHWCIKRFGKKIAPDRYSWLGMELNTNRRTRQHHGGWSSGGGGWSSGGGGFSGGGGSSGGGGASGGW